MNSIRLLFALLFIFLLAGAKAQTKKIIPAPVKEALTTERFSFTPCTRLNYNKKNQEIRKALAPLISKLSRAAAINLESPSSCAETSSVNVTLDPAISNDEGYLLTISKKTIDIKAQQPAGIFYAVTSLLQLLPEAIESRTTVPNVAWSVSCGVVEDSPRFSYRGIMLDVSRHFMQIDSIKRIIDLMSMQKLNKFHWHLTDNDGWRFESKKYPKLTSVGAYRKGSPIGNNITYDYNSLPGEKLYGGFYTQDQMRELVKYAADRFVTIIPEIEMPAHAKAAIASYPELSCLDSNGTPFRYPQNIQGEFCTKAETFNFLTEILAEVMDIFPSKYIHIGGDEAEKLNWQKCRHCTGTMKKEGLKDVNELQSYFIKRIEKFVNSNGRNIIGWDEIMHGGIAPNAAVMSWTGVKSGIAAAKEKHEVVMSPLPYCYFDHAQSDAPGEPEGYPGLTMLKNVYEYEPVPEELTLQEVQFIKGAQANLWTEYVPTASHAEYMLFPRSLALAEICWSNREHKSFGDFTRRLDDFKKRWDFSNVNYSKHTYDIRISNLKIEKGKFTATISGSENNLPIHYTLDGTVPTKNSPVYTKPLTIQKSCTITAAIIDEGHPTDVAVKEYIIHKATGKKTSLAILPQYNKTGTDGWVNGSLADDKRFNDYRNEDEERYNDDKWLGWDDKRFEGTIDLGKREIIHRVRLRFYHNVPFGIMIPSSVTVQLSDDGKQFRTVKTERIKLPKETGAVELPVLLAGSRARYIRIVAEPYGQTPAGNNAWLFTDEVVVE